MSTINRMLTSLDARAAPPGARGLPGEVRALPAARHRHRRHALLGAVLIAAAALAAWDQINPLPGPPAEAGVAVDGGNVDEGPAAGGTGSQVGAASVQPRGPADPAPGGQTPGEPGPEAAQAAAAIAAAQSAQSAPPEPPRSRSPLPSVVRTAAVSPGPTPVAMDDARGDSGTAQTDPAAVPRAMPPSSEEVKRRRADENSSVLARRGADALASGHTRLAVSWLREALAQDDDEAQVHLDLATALLHLRDADGALAHARRAAAIWGETSNWPLQARRVLAMAHAQRREWDLVLQVAEPVQAAGDAVLLAVRAAAYVGQRRWHDALGIYEGLVAGAPREARWWLGLATAQQALGQWNDARASLRAAAGQARDETVLAAAQAQLAAMPASHARDGAGEVVQPMAPTLAARGQP